MLLGVIQEKLMVAPSFPCDVTCFCLTILQTCTRSCFALHLSGQVCSLVTGQASEHPAANSQSRCHGSHCDITAMQHTASAA